MLCCRIAQPNASLTERDWLLRRLSSAPLRLSPHLAGGALTKNCTTQKVDKSTVFCVSKTYSFFGRGINFAMLCYRIAPLVFPYRLPRGPLQRTALSKKLINQLFLFLATMSASKLAPYYPKTKGVEFSTPFCFVCSLRREGDLKVEPLGSSSRGYH